MRKKWKARVNDNRKGNSWNHESVVVCDDWLVDMINAVRLIVYAMRDLVLIAFASLLHNQIHRHFDSATIVAEVMKPGPAMVIVINITFSNGPSEWKMRLLHFLLSPLLRLLALSSRRFASFISCLVIMCRNVSHSTKSQQQPAA